jgi:hypothetical protein
MNVSVLFSIHQRPAARLNASARRHHVMAGLVPAIHAFPCHTLSFACHPKRGRDKNPDGL